MKKICTSAILLLLSFNALHCDQNIESLLPKNNTHTITGCHGLWDGGSLVIHIKTEEGKVMLVYKLSLLVKKNGGRFSYGSIQAYANDLKNENVYELNENDFALLLTALEKSMIHKGALDMLFLYANENIDEGKAFDLLIPTIASVLRYQAPKNAKSTELNLAERKHVLECLKAFSQSENAISGKILNLENE